MHLADRLAAMVAGASLALTIVPSAAHAASSPAALLIFPEIVVDSAAGIDTVVELGNTSDAVVEVRCLYDDETTVCMGTGTCRPSPASCSGSCAPRRVALPFRVRLTANQPLGWNAAQGLVALPLDGQTTTGSDGTSNAGTRVPALTTAPEGLFQGSLRCVVTDERGRPAERNLLVGSASIEATAAAAPHVDAARYDAVGLAAIAGMNDGDEILRLGGAQPEYAACPGSLVLPHVFDGAVAQAAGTASAVLTTVALVPCGGDVVGGSPGSSVVQMQVRNELAQHFSTSRPFQGQLVSQLSLLDTSQAVRSIFSAGVAGTLTGQSDFQGIGSAILAVAVEARSDTGDPVAQHAGLPFFGEGAAASPDVLAMLLPPCHGDCNGDGQVTIDELMLSVRIALERSPIEACLAIDDDESGTARVDELVGAVGVALTSCPARALPTTPPEPGATPTSTPVPSEPGPNITFFGIASGDDAPQEPVGTDDQGRPIYTWPVGQGFSLIVEARPDSNSHSPIGVQAAAASEDLLPDMQMIVSRALGDGSSLVCDADPPTLGGVPAVEPFEFRAEPEVVHAINDLGCRTDDGLGMPRGRSGGGRQCTRIPPVNDPGFVSAGSSVQFCIPIARAWAFPEGDTTVAVRIRDVEGTLGPTREMVIRIPAGP